MEMHVFEASLYDTQYQFLVSQTERERLRCGKVQLRLHVNPALRTNRRAYSFYNRWSKEGRSEGNEEFNGIRTDQRARCVMDMIQFLMPQLKIHKHELLV